MTQFSGVKIALIKDDEILVIQRDNKPTIPFPNMWDLPGGGREGSETPFACIAREVHEELSLTLEPNKILWQKIYPAMHDPELTSYFMVAHIDNNEIAKIVLGSEGQGWKMVKINDFMADQTSIEFLKMRVRDYIASLT